MKSEMETVGIREFRKNLAGYLESSAPVAITRHGETIGFFLPAPPKRTEEQWAEFDRAAARLDQMIAETGLSEEEFVEDFKRWRASEKLK
jgi:antitoxin (DNA-binding transcriptional repressor) of toxin-antitoxin stability system